VVGNGHQQPVDEASTDFQMGFALLAFLLLVRWPGAFAGGSDTPAALVADAARYAAVLTAGV